MTTVRLAQLVENPDNPRETLGSIVELAASIVEIGLLQPLLVMADDAGGYLVVDGHRRFAAMQSVGYAKPIPVVLTDMNRAQRIVAAVSAGAYTRPINAIERARAFRQLRDECGLTQVEIAKRCGCSQATVNSGLRLIELDAEAQAKVQAGEMSAQQAIRVVRARLKHPQGRKTLTAAPLPAADVAEILLRVKLTPTADRESIARDVATWFGGLHQVRKVPHHAQMLSVVGWSYR